MTCSKSFLLLIAAFISPTCFANEPIALDAISVFHHYDNAVGTSDAASEGIVTSQLLKNRPIMRIGELMEFVPGMIATQHSGDGKANQYFLRGFNLDHGTDFATYVDGIPVNMRTHAHGQGYTDLNFLIPELVGQIHYKKGPYFAEEGDFASAGAARLSLVNTLPQGIATASLGSYGYQRLLLADSFSLAEGNLLYGLELHRNDGPWKVDQDVEKYNALVRYSKGDSQNGFNITAMAYDNQWTATDQIPLRAVRSGQLDRFGSVDPTNGGESSRYSLSFTKNKRDQHGAMIFNVYALRSELDLYSNFTYFLNDPVNGDQFNQFEERDMVGLNLTKSWFSKWGGFDVENTIGLQSRYDRLSPVALFNTRQRQRLSVIRSDKVDETSAGIFAENKTQWLEKFRTVAGLRYDHFLFDVNSSIAGNSGHTNDGIVSPKLSLIFGPWAQTEYFINYGEGFHSNDARGTTQTRLPSGEPTSPVTPLVKSRGSELGVRIEIIPGLQSSLTVWQLKLDSELVFVGDAGETEASRASQRYGIEWSNHYVANQWLLFDFDIALSKARFRDNDPAGDRIPGTISQVASFAATVTDWNNWFGAVQMRYFGPRPLIEDNRVRSNSTILTNARVGYRFNPKLTLAMDLFNVFDRKVNDIDYFYGSRLADEPAEVEDIHFHPVEPRTVRLTLTYNF